MSGTKGLELLVPPQHSKVQAEVMAWSIVYLPFQQRDLTLVPRDCVLKKPAMSISIRVDHLPVGVWRSRKSEVLAAEDRGEGSGHLGGLVRSALGLFFDTLLLLGAISFSYVPLFIIITLPGSWPFP